MSGLKNHHQRALNQASAREADKRHEVFRALEALGISQGDAGRHHGRDSEGRVGGAILPRRGDVRQMTRFWFIVHNLIAHPLLLTGAGWAGRFHDWTADRM